MSMVYHLGSSTGEIECWAGISSKLGRGATGDNPTPRGGRGFAIYAIYLQRADCGTRPCLNRLI